MTNSPGETAAEIAPPAQVGLAPSRVWATRALLAVGVLLVIYTAVRFAYGWKTGKTLGQSSAILMGQAMDLADGVFYRPLEGERGFGGTRNMPLTFVLLAGLLKIGIGPVHGGLIVTLIGDGVLLSGVYVLLRRVGVDRMLAAAGAGLCLGCLSVHSAAVTYRGDLLPAGLNAWGLAMAACGVRTGDGRETRPRAVLAAVFFVLAFAGKMTALWALGAAALALLACGWWKEAVKLVVLAALGVAIVIGLTQLASGGRFLENLRDCASGGLGAKSLANWPRAIGGRGFGRDHMAAVATTLAVFGLLFGLVWRPRWSDLRETPAVALFAAMGATAFVYLSPGTGANHLIDLCIVAVVFAVVLVQRERVPAVIAIAVLALVGLVSLPVLLKSPIRGTGRQKVAAALKELGPSDGRPFLSRNPMMHVYNGETPYVLDPWMYRNVLLKKFPAIEQEMYRRLEQRRFRAVVLTISGGEEEGGEGAGAAGADEVDQPMDDEEEPDATEPSTKSARGHGGKGHRAPVDPAVKWEKNLQVQFGAGFLSKLNENYEESARTWSEGSPGPRHVIYRPRSGPTTQAGQ